jgi:acyl-coenzyme A thioesterase PaaI-like protein
MSAFGNVLKTWKQIEKIPFGKSAFSFFFSVKAPYFRSIRPHVHELEAGFAKVSLSQRWAIQNHIKTVHAIAVCNLIEMAMGLVAESTIPKHLRWLPKGMDVKYLKKASGTLTATTKIDPETFFLLEKYPGDVSVPVSVRDENNVEVTTGEVRLWISLKPEKK